MALVISLPTEILSYIATFLTPTDLRNCNVVCERFGSICRDYNLWRRFFVDINTSSPSGRLCHTAVIYNYKMYIYGGHITQPSSEYFHVVKNDLYEYDLITREWKEIPVGEGAPRRTEHTAILYNNSMVVFGGYSGSGYENSVMVFDFTTFQWRQLVTTGEPPSARSAHTAVLVGNSMFVFGGWNGQHCMNDMYELNFETQVWALICEDTSVAARAQARSTVHAGANADRPSARCSHGAVVLTRPADGADPPSHVMYIFGGYAIEGANESPNKGYLDDLYEFHFETKKWACSKAQGIPPCPRSRFRMISYKDSIYVFAGWNSTKHFSTLHSYNSWTKRWVEVETSFDPDGIGQFSMVENNGIMYIFSGFSPKIGCRTNLFAYPLAPSPSRQAH